MTAGLPSHQGFTFIGGAGISSVYNSNLYFSDDQITALSGGGWYVFLQDSSTSLPYSAHEVTTDTDAYETGEFMHVKNFDFVSIFFKRILQTFPGRYNINATTLKLIRGALEGGIDTLLGRTFPRIGTPLISGTITSIAKYGSEADRVECYMTIELPTVLNKLALHLVA
jgi:hypothetical protein